MALQTVQFLSKVWLYVRPCQEVAVCLSSADGVVSGFPIVFATIENSGRHLGRFNPWRTMDPRDAEVYEYALTFDDTQFIEGIVPPCEDIVEINPYPCSMHAILDAIEELQP